jgi:hypothetical protein
MTDGAPCQQRTKLTHLRPHSGSCQGSSPSSIPSCRRLLARLEKRQVWEEREKRDDRRELFVRPFWCCGAWIVPERLLWTVFWRGVAWCVVCVGESGSAASRGVDRMTWASRGSRSRITISGHDLGSRSRLILHDCEEEEERPFALSFLLVLRPSIGATTREEEACDVVHTHTHTHTHVRVHANAPAVETGGRPHPRHGGRIACLFSAAPRRRGPRHGKQASKPR